MNSLRSSVVAAGTLAACGLAIGTLGSCAGPSEGAARPQDVFWPRESSLEHHERAHALWQHQMVTREAAPAEAYALVLEALADARSGDSRIALYPGVEGWLHIDLADAAARREDEAAVDRHLQDAREAFRDSRALCEDWVPAHLGLARVARLERRWDQAEEHVLEAHGSIRRALGPIERERTWGEVLFGRKPERRPNPLSSVPTEKERQQLLLEQLAQSERWTLNPPPGGDLGSGMTGNQLLRRFRDRLALERANLNLARAAAEGDSVERRYRAYVDEIEAEVLARGGDDLVEAYRDCAVGYAALGDPESLDVAISDLSYLQSLPLLANSGDLRRNLEGLRARRDLERARAALATWRSGADETGHEKAVAHLNQLFGRQTKDLAILTDATVVYCDLMRELMADASDPEAAQLRDLALQRILLLERVLPEGDPHGRTLDEARQRLEEQE